LIHRSRKRVGSAFAHGTADAPCAGASGFQDVRQLALTDALDRPAAGNEADSYPCLTWALPNGPWMAISYPRRQPLRTVGRRLPERGQRRLVVLMPALMLAAATAPATAALLPATKTSKTVVWRLSSVLPGPDVPWRIKWAPAPMVTQRMPPMTAHKTASMPSRPLAASVNPTRDQMEATAAAVQIPPRLPPILAPRMAPTTAPRLAPTVGPIRVHLMALNVFVI